jgi:hypothetical protein
MLTNEESYDIGITNYIARKIGFATMKFPPDNRFSKSNLASKQAMGDLLGKLHNL